MKNKKEQKNKPVHWAAFFPFTFCGIDSRKTKNLKASMYECEVTCKSCLKKIEGMMNAVNLSNNICSKLKRIQHKDNRYARLKLEMFEAQELSDLQRIDSELTEIVNEIEKKEVEEFGV